MKSRFLLVLLPLLWAFAAGNLVADAAPASRPIKFIIYPFGDSPHRDGEPYRFAWNGQPPVIRMHVLKRKATDRTMPIPVLAIGSNGKPAGQINGPGAKDDLVWTGQNFTFAPPGLGTYRLMIMKQLVAVLSIYDPAKEPVTLSYNDWRAVEGKPNLYSRFIDISWENSTRIDHMAALAAPSTYFQRKLRFKIIPVFPTKNVSQISWVIVSKSPDIYEHRANNVATQYFLYDPLRDAPRNPNIYLLSVSVNP